MADRQVIINRLRELGYVDQLINTPAEFHAAVDIYQRQNDLPATGQVDYFTAQSLFQPRFCGHPDVMPLTTEEARWPGPEVTWCVRAGSRFGGLGGTAEIKDVFEWVFATWRSVAGVLPKYNPNERTAHVLIESGTIDNDPFGVLAYSNLADGTWNQKGQRYDDVTPWAYSANPGQREIDLGRVGLHEVGHVWGMPHITRGNLLQPTYDTNIRLPQSGDITYMRQTLGYGPPIGDPQPPPPDGPGGQKVTITLEIEGIIIGGNIPGHRLTKLSN